MEALDIILAVQLCHLFLWRGKTCRILDSWPMN
jgi:hypothetical protein